MYAYFEDHSLIFVFNLGCGIHFFYWNYIHVLETVENCKSECCIKRHGTLFKRMCQLNKDRDMNCFSFIFGLECLFILRAKYTWLKSERVCSLKHLYHTLVDYLEWREWQRECRPISPSVVLASSSHAPNSSSYMHIFSSYVLIFSSFVLIFSS